MSRPALKESEMPSIERLVELFFVADDGRLVRKASGSRGKIESVAGWINSGGYICVMVDGVSLKAHRVVWAIFNGKWPNGHIDHINGVRNDNRIENLRDVSIQVNAQNRQAASRNATGMLGVYKAKYGFLAKIGFEGKQYNLGTFKTAEEAQEAYIKAKRDIHAGSTL